FRVIIGQVRGPVAPWQLCLCVFLAVRFFGAAFASVFPPALEPGRCQLGVAHRVLDVFVPEVCLQRPRIPPCVRLLVSAGVPQHVRVCLDFEPSGSQARLMSFWKLLTVIGEPRSDTNRNGDRPSASRCRRRSARSSRPVSGWVDGDPCFARVTASVAPAKSTWVPWRSQTSDRRPCREAIRIMVWSRCGCRLPSHPSISFSTSFSVRYSRVLTSAFLGRRGVTFRFTVAGDTIFRAGFVIWISVPVAVTFGKY